MMRMGRSRAVPENPEVEAEHIKSSEGRCSQREVKHQRLALISGQ